MIIPILITVMVSRQKKIKISPVKQRLLTIYSCEYVRHFAKDLK